MYANIALLFETAVNAKLKYPKIHIHTPETGEVVVKRAGDKSKYTGQIMVTDGQPFGANKYFGRIDTNGLLTAGRDLTPAVEALLQRFAADPVKVAKDSALLTGRCMFCDKALNDSRSTANGYGPVCAKKYNLPWDASKDSRASKALETSATPILETVESGEDVKFIGSLGIAEMNPGFAL